MIKFIIYKNYKVNTKPLNIYFCERKNKFMFDLVQVSTVFKYHNKKYLINYYYYDKKYLINNFYYNFYTDLNGIKVIMNKSKKYNLKNDLKKIIEDLKKDDLKKELK
jgi:hypothetical protein